MKGGGLACKQYTDATLTWFCGSGANLCYCPEIWIHSIMTLVVCPFSSAASRRPWMRLPRTTCSSAACAVTSPAMTTRVWIYSCAVTRSRRVPLSTPCRLPSCCSKRAARPAVGLARRRCSRVPVYHWGSRYNRECMRALESRGQERTKLWRLGARAKASRLIQHNETPSAFIGQRR